MTDPVDDEPSTGAVLADLFDTFVDELFEGRPIDVASALPSKPELRGRVEHIYQLARDVVGDAPDNSPSFEGFEIVRELGRGGMGVVYLARQAGLDRRIALKVLPPAFGLSSRTKLRFLAEAKALAALTDDHIVRIYQIIEHQGTLAYAMEWVDGPNLKRVIEQLKHDGRPPSLERLARILGCEHDALEGASWSEWVGTQARRANRSRAVASALRGARAPRHQTLQHPDPPRRPAATHGLRAGART